MAAMRADHTPVGQRHRLLRLYRGTSRMKDETMPFPAQSIEPRASDRHGASNRQVKDDIAVRVGS